MVESNPKEKNITRIQHMLKGFALNETIEYPNGGYSLDKQNHYMKYYRKVYRLLGEDSEKKFELVDDKSSLDEYVMSSRTYDRGQGADTSTFHEQDYERVRKQMQEGLGNYYRDMGGV